MISKDKEYRTRDGHEVRIYATDGGGTQPIHAAYRDEHNKWHSSTWSLEGKFFLSGDPCRYDLIEVKPRIKRTVWLNVYEGDTGKAHESKDRADRAADCLSRVACVKVEIDCEEGEGL